MQLEHVLLLAMSGMSDDKFNGKGTPYWIELSQYKEIFINLKSLKDKLSNHELRQLYPHTGDSGIIRFYKYLEEHNKELVWCFEDGILFLYGEEMLSCIKNCMKTYKISTINSQECIKCLYCGMVSYNPNDVKQKFCGACKVFHK